jgi:hypothetical protein
MRWALQLLTALLTPAFSRGVAGVGYVPEYRFDTVDWKVAVSSTTHLILFSLEPDATGALLGLDRMEYVLKKSSNLRRAMRGLGEAGPKLLISVGGGAGRSKHFAQVAKKPKARKNFVGRLTKLLEDQPLLSGVDLNWEAPTSVQQWRDLGRLAQEFRLAATESKRNGTLQGDALLSMAYHPNLGAVANFSGLRGKASDKGFAELFDLCHAMAYTTFDDQRRHTSQQTDQAAIDEWASAGLPMNRLTLGIPFFGVLRKTGETVPFQDLAAKEPWLTSNPQVDEASGVYFVNTKSISKKVRFAARPGWAGVMRWELGQDSKDGHLLRSVWSVSQTAAQAQGSWGDYFQDLLERAKEIEDWLITVFSGGLGVWFMGRTLTFKRHKYHVPPVKARASQPKAAKPAESVDAQTESEGASATDGAADTDQTADK